MKELIQEWAPLVWLAPGERFLPLGVPEFLDNMDEDDDYLSTRSSLREYFETLLTFELYSSWLGIKQLNPRW